MRVVKSVLGSLTAASLLVAQPVLAVETPSRGSAESTEESELGGSPFLIIGVLIGAILALELTGAIDIFGDDPVSP